MRKRERVRCVHGTRELFSTASDPIHPSQKAASSPPKLPTPSPSQLFTKLYPPHTHPSHCCTASHTRAWANQCARCTPTLALAFRALCDAGTASTQEFIPYRRSTAHALALAPSRSHRAWSWLGTACGLAERRYPFSLRAGLVR